MLRNFCLKNKPLYLTEHKGSLYIGDAHGNIFALSGGFDRPKQLLQAFAPVSSIVFLDDEMFFGTWDGIINNSKTSKKLGIDPIKCMAVYNGKIFVSVDKKLFVLNSNLEILEEYSTEYKIYCMDVSKDELNLGLSTGMIAKYVNTYENAYLSQHVTTILCIKGELSGSADGTLRKDNNLLFSGKEWIRSIWNENLFSAGPNVYLNGKIIYFHEDEVMGIIQIKDKIISIGLDYCYKLFEEGIGLSKNEEDEIMKMLE